MAGSRSFKFWLKIFVVFLLIFLIFQWFSSHSKLEINVSNSNGSSINIDLLNQAGDKVSSFTSNKPKINRLISKGNYEVSVSQKDRNYFTVIKAKGFLAKNHVNASLVSEKHRSFVGDDPGPCMLYANVLYSYQCGRDFGTINKHIPASVDLPAYIDKIPQSAARGLVEDIIKIDDGFLVLLHETDVEGSEINTAYQLDNDLKIIRQVDLADFDSSTSHKIVGYQSGFLIYDSDFKKVMYYESINAKPKELGLSSQSGGLNPISLTVSGNSVLAVYSSLSDDALDDQKINAQARNKLVVYRDGQIKDSDLNGIRISSASVCGEQLLCVLSGKNLLVYRTSEKTSLLYSIHGVNNIQVVGSSVLAVRKKDVLNLNAALSSGFADYSFGNYGYCGLQPVDPTKYVLCISNPNGKSAALLIDQGTNNQDSIDKKILELQKTAEVANVTIYQTYIFITPNMGELKYDASLKIFNYDQETYQKVTKKIDSKADSLGINRDIYHIIYTSP